MAQTNRARLPWTTKLLYGMGDWGFSTTGTIFTFFFAFFLTDIARLDPLYAAPVLLLGGVWDAINDPIVGVMIDRVRTRWGRRRPFFLFGSLPFLLGFIMLWWVPPTDSQLIKAIYYGVAYIFFDTFSTLIAVPFTALTPELTDDYDERTRLNGYRMVVSMLGGLISSITVPLIAGLFPERKTGYLLMAVVFGVLAIVPYLMLFFRIKERFNETEQSHLGLFSGFAYTWRNKAFRYAAGIYLTAWVMISLVSSLLQYYVTYYLGRPDQLEIMLGAVQIGALICVPLAVVMAQRLGKQRAYLIATASLIVVMLTLSFLPPNVGSIVFVVALLAGPGIASAHVVPWSIMPDVIEADELETGQRREGTYYGFMVFLQKTGVAVVLALMQWVLHITGYVPDAVQNPSVLVALRLLIGPLPVALLLVSMLLAWRYPINKQKHEEMLARLAERRALAAAAADD